MVFIPHPHPQVTLGSLKLQVSLPSAAQETQCVLKASFRVTGALEVKGSGDQCPLGCDLFSDP